MTLEWESITQTHGGSSAITRFFIKMPVRRRKVCMIRQVVVLLFDHQIINTYDVAYGLSIDPDDPGDSLLNADSRMFVLGRWTDKNNSNVGRQTLTDNPVRYMFPEGITCAYGRIPFFIQNSNNNAATHTTRLTVFFEFIEVSPQEVAVAVVRRGRGVSRRVP